MLTSAVVVIYPKTIQSEFLTDVSHATLASGSWAKHASKTESEM